MGRWASVFLLLALAAVSGRHAQPTCPVPSTSLMRQDDGRCSSDAVPPPMPQQPLPAAKEPKLPSFEEWKQDHVEEPVPRPLNPKATSAAVEEEVTHATRASADITDSAVLPAQPPRTRPADVEQAPAAVETPSALATTSYVHPQPNAGTGMTGDPLLPLKSRTNYASNDCAAVVLRSSKASKHASSILTSAKDRYMLTPCAADNKFVVVELCDEIDIDTVVLANWEFFSSMFKLFRASVSEVYPGRDEDWRELGTFRAGNLRGSQVRVILTGDLVAIDQQPTGLPPASPRRLLPLHPHRLSHPLRHRVLLPRQPRPDLRSHPNGSLPRGGTRAGGGAPQTGVDRAC